MMKIRASKIHKIQGGGAIPFAKVEPENPCPPGEHVERIYFPWLEPAEWSPKGRLEKLKEACNDPFEIIAAEHNMAKGDVSHGRQISRNATPSENVAGKKGDHQHIKAVCIRCGYFREIDHVADDGSVVECKETEDFVGSDQYKNNLKLLERGYGVVYKLPNALEAKNNGQRFQRLLALGFKLVFV